jgi:NADP-dependent 3-hydroxy acid dehydrogenase YdfG
MSNQSVIAASYAKEDIAMAKVWLITGSGNGLGRHIAETALAAGDSVVAGARRTEELAPLVAQYGHSVKPITLEVRDEANTPTMLSSGPSIRKFDGKTTSP